MRLAVFIFTFFVFFVNSFCNPLLAASALKPQHASRLPQKTLALPRIFGDHMVLQRGKPIRIWGWGGPNTTITVKLKNRECNTRALNNGTWLLEFPSQKAGGPYTMTVTDGKQTISFMDVLIGEVWLCSGQSNMEFTLDNPKKYHGLSVKNAKEEVAKAKYPKIRLFKVKRAKSLTPKYDFQAGEWQLCTPESASDFSATAYFFGRKLFQALNIPVGLIQSAWGGSSCQAWNSNDTIKNFPNYKAALKNNPKGIMKQGPYPKGPTILYNAMIQPLIPYVIAGFIWYQGEANRWRAKEYTKLFPAMIKDWRGKFKQGDIPFFYCQIAPFAYKTKEAGVKMREAQREVMSSLPNLGMVVLNDKTDIKLIHPPYKKAAGERLAGWALNKVYGKKVPYSGPLFKNFKADSRGNVTVFFEYADGLKGSADAFELAGSNGVFHKAKGKIKGNTVVLNSNEVKKPKAVRYAWSNVATGGLFNKYGLPTSSFTSAEWNDKPPGNK